MSVRIQNSSQAVAILHLLSKEEEGDYSKSIAEQLDKPIRSVNRLLRKMLEEGLVKYGKRTQAKYYEIDPEGIAYYWIQTIEEHYEDIKHRDDQTIEERYESFQNNREQIKDFLTRFLPLVLQSYSLELDSTLEDLLFEATAKTILELETIDSEHLEGREYLKTLPLLVSDYKGTYAYTMEAATVLSSELERGGFVEHLVEDEDGTQ